LLVLGGIFDRECSCRFVLLWVSGCLALCRVDGLETVVRSAILLFPHESQDILFAQEVSEVGYSILRVADELRLGLSAVELLAIYV